MSREFFVNNLSSTSIKLDGKNYLLWSQAFETFLGVHQKIRRITLDPPDAKDAAYEHWFVDDCVVILWLVNNMNDSIVRGVMMLKPAKKVWDTLRSTYGNEKNIARVCEIYEYLFTYR